MAIENEDFDSAKILKYEIDRIRSMAMSLDTDRVILTPIRSSRQPLKDMNNGEEGGYEDWRS
jgi:hypothetical protein